MKKDTKKKEDWKKENGVKVACGHANWYLPDTAPIGYRLPDIESKQSVWMEQATTPLHDYTNPYTGEISAPKVMAEKVINAPQTMYRIITKINANQSK